MKFLLLMAIAVSAAPASGVSRQARALQTEVDHVRVGIRHLKATDPCFKWPYTKSLDATEKCWSSAPERAAIAQAAASNLVDQLNNVMDSGYLGFGKIVKDKFDLMSSTGLYCDERMPRDTELTYISSDDQLFIEWTSSLLVCARTTSSNETYGQLREVLANNIDRFDQPTQKRILQLWLDGYIYEYSPGGDFSEMATALSRSDLDGWKAFMEAVQHHVATIEVDISAQFITSDEISAAKKAIADS
jgi:hypothetical protein